MAKILQRCWPVTAAICASQAGARFSILRETPGALDADCRDRVRGGEDGGSLDQAPREGYR